MLFAVLKSPQIFHLRRSLARSLHIRGRRTAIEFAEKVRLKGRAHTHALSGSVSAKYCDDMFIFCVAGVPCQSLEDDHDDYY